MYTLLKKTTSEPCHLTATNNLGGFDMYLYLRGMNYNSKRATFDYQLSSYAYSGTGGLGANFTIDVNGVQITRDEYGALGAFSKRGTITIPYNEDGTLDDIKLNVSYGTGSFTPWGYYGQRILPLQKEPFVVDAFWGETWLDEDSLPASYYVQDTENRNYQVVVPYVPGSVALRCWISGYDNTGLRTIYEFIVDEPEVGVYDINFSLSLLGIDALYKSISYRATSTGKEPLNYYESSFDIGFGDEVYSRAIPFRVLVTPGKPELTATVVDVNPATLTLTGDSSILIRDASTARATMTANGVAGAIISKHGIINGQYHITDAYTYDFERIGSNLFDFYATDNRNYTTSIRVAPAFIEYVAPTAKIVGSIMTGEGNMDIKVTGSYFKGSFGASENSLVVYYRYKLQYADDEAFTDWIQLTDISLNEENNTFSVIDSITGLNYEDAYVFQARVADALYTVYSADYIAVSKPLFDWGANDFNFNVPVNINGSLTVNGVQITGEPEEDEPEDKTPNKILWQGVEVMLDSDTIELSEAVSAQHSGIVLVFTIGGLQGGENSCFNTFFVPKMMTGLYNGGSQTFMMTNTPVFGAIGAKSLTINDRTITGHSSNNSSGNSSAGGVTYGNQYFTLRYVIGV